MNILYFGNFLSPTQTKLNSLETKIFFKENVLKDIAFTWEETCLINELNKTPYNGLFLDLSSLTGNHSFERQYITRIILRVIDDRPKSFFVCMNQFTYDCLVHESIKDLTKVPNLFIRDSVKNTDIKCLEYFLKVKK